MQGIATARQHERTRKTELAIIKAVAPSLIDDRNSDEASGRGTTLYLNECPGAEFLSVYGSWIEIVTR